MGDSDTGTQRLSDLGHGLAAMTWGMRSGRPLRIASVMNILRKS